MTEHSAGRSKLTRRALLASLAGVATTGGGCLSRDPPACGSDRYVGERVVSEWLLEAPLAQRDRVDRLASRLDSGDYFVRTYRPIDLVRSRPQQGRTGEGNRYALVVVGAITGKQLRTAARDVGVTIRELTESAPSGNPFVSERQEFRWPWTPSTLEARVDALERFGPDAGVPLPEIRADGSYLVIESADSETIDRVQSLFRPIGVIVAEWFDRRFVSLGRPEGNRVRPDSITVTGSGPTRSLRFETVDGGRGYSALLTATSDQRGKLADEPIRFYFEGDFVAERRPTDEELTFARSQVAPRSDESRVNTVVITGLAPALALQMASALFRPAAVPLAFEARCDDARLPPPRNAL